MTSSLFRIQRSVSLLAGGILFTLLSPTFAQATGSGSSVLGPLSEQVRGLSIGPGAFHVFGADLRGGAAGDVSVSRFPIQLDYNPPPDARGFLRVNSVYEYSDYRWSDEDFFETTDRVAFSALGLRRFSESPWGIFAFGQVAWTAEANGGDLSRGFSSTVIAGPAYSFSRALSVSAGALVSVQPERETRVFPVGSVNWRINEQWSLRTLNGAIVTFVPDPEERRLQVDFSTEYRTRGIRLRRQLLPDGSMRRPVAEEREIAAGVGAIWRMTDHWSLQTNAEYLFGRKWRFRSDETDYRTVDADNAVLAGLRLFYAF